MKNYDLNIIKRMAEGVLVSALNGKEPNQEKIAGATAILQNDVLERISIDLQNIHKQLTYLNSNVTDIRSKF